MKVSYPQDRDKLSRSCFSLKAAAYPPKGTVRPRMIRLYHWHFLRYLEQCWYCFKHNISSTVFQMG